MSAERRPASPVVVGVEARATLSLAMFENAIPLVSRISLTNPGEVALEALEVEVALLPDLSQKWTTHVAAIPPGGTWNVDDIDLPLDRARLVNQLERSAGELVVWVRAHGATEPLATTQQRVDVLAYNEWVHDGLPQLLAAFILPNHPAIAGVLADARRPLEELTGSPALDGYQAGSPRRVAAIAEAVYRTIQARGITYSNPPASFEKTGQKIRTPEQLLGEQVGTCLDLSVFVAASLEQAGLHPVILLMDEHAFPGVWLESHVVADGLIDDIAMVRKLVGLGRLLVFDSSTAVHRPAKAFAEARRIGEQHLETMAFHALLDVAGAREEKFRPLPARVGPGYAAVVEVPVQAPASGPAGVPAVAPGDGSGRSKGSARTRHPRVDAWKQRLLDTSLRNRLLNFKDTKQGLELLFDDLGSIEDHLASSRELTVRGRPALLGGDDPRSRKLLEARLADDAVKTFLRDRLARGELHAAQPSEAMDGRLLAIFRAARQALEETGTNQLCLAVGMLHWYETDTSEEPRRAPILLLPVSLQRNARTAGYTLRSTGEDARLNVTLFEKLRLDRGITVPELAELPVDDAGVDVRAVLDRVREAVLNLRRWEVREELHLGLFSFAKFQMWADLDQNLDVLLQAPVVQHLLHGKGDRFPNAGAFPEPDELDARYAPRDLLCPLDADASQLAAVAAATEGRTFVLQGPPGTGKSQTITNLITHAIAQGQRVLFVAEKAAALEVVQRRLAQVGLGPYVLELHSHKAGKLQVLEQFRAALEAAPVSAPASWDHDARKLADERQHLNAYVRALHQPGDAGFSLFQALGQLGRLRDATLLPLPASCAASAEHLAALQAQVDDLADALATVGPVAHSAWAGCQVLTWRVDLPSQVSEAIDAALAALADSARSATALALALGASAPRTFADADALAGVAAALATAPPHGPALAHPDDFAQAEHDGRELALVVRTRAEALAHLRQRYADSLFALDLPALAARFRKYAHAFVLLAWWGLRHARKAVRAVARDGRLPDRAQLADDLERARATRDHDALLAARDARGRELYGPAWRASDSDPAQLDAALAWACSCRDAFAAVRPGLLGAGRAASPAPAELAAQARAQLDAARQAVRALDALLGRADTVSNPTATGAATTDWDDARARVERWRASLHTLRAWHTMQTAQRALAAAGCAPLVDAALGGALAPDQLRPSFLRSAYTAWVRHALGRDPVLASFDGDAHRKHIQSFADLERRLLASARDVARSQVAARAPVAGAAAGGEMGVLQKELQKKRGHLPIRKLLAQIPALAARMKPCFLMSPMSVATYLDPRMPAFDLIVFDEASQIPTHDAIGALARGASAVVVGDSKQLPPTAFFQSQGDDEPVDDNDFEELESILNECIASGIPERRLDWHYRSRHESLIAFSNHAYYDNRLNTFPSAAERGDGRGVTLRRIAGFYDKGGSRTNKAEAQALVDDLLARLRAPGASARTYGVVTFSQAQQELVEDLLDQARAQDPQLEPFFDQDTNPEHVIVKNLENIQGDERDVMLFSICYGPDQTGRVSMNFGPLNRDGGERRLNVAVTRAREELVVYATLQPEHIDLTRTKARGVKDLKTFLDYAARGPRAIAEALTVTADDHFDSPFEHQVCARLRALGLTVHTQVGCAGYRLDLGLVDPDEPGRYVLAVECDGAHYHSARSARERDRLRAQVLAGLGWRIHRIWSTDWWQAPDRELEKVKAAFELARREASQSAVVAAAAPPPARVAPSATPSAVVTSESARRARATPPSVRAVPSGAHEPPSASTVARTGAADPLGARPYLVAKVPGCRLPADGVHDDRHRDETLKLLLDVVAQEAPLSLRTLSKRIAPYFGIQRSSARLDERLRSLLDSRVRIHDEIIWRLDQDPASYREYRAAPADGKRDASEVPTEEIANAAAAVLRGSISLDHDELVKLTARALGYGRMGGKVADQMEAGIALLLARGEARRNADKVELA